MLISKLEETSWILLILSKSLLFLFLGLRGSVFVVVIDIIIHCWLVGLDGGFALISIFNIDNFDEIDINFCDYFVCFFLCAARSRPRLSNLARMENLSESLVNGSNLEESVINLLLQQRYAIHLLKPNQTESITIY